MDSHAVENRTRIFALKGRFPIPFRRQRDRNRSDRPPIGSVVPLLSVVFKWCYRHRFASGGVFSPMEFVDTIIEPSPSNKRFLRLSVVRIIKRRAKFISTRKLVLAAVIWSRTDTSRVRAVRTTAILNRNIQVFKWNPNQWLRRWGSNPRLQGMNLVRNLSSTSRYRQGT